MKRLDEIEIKASLINDGKHLAPIVAAQEIRCIPISMARSRRSKRARGGDILVVDGDALKEIHVLTKTKLVLRESVPV